MSFNISALYKNNRTRIVVIGLLLFALLLIGKLFSLQIIHKNYFTEKADHQYVTNPSSLFERGNIYFTSSNGELISAATQIVEYKLAIHPNEISKGQILFETLNKILPIDMKDFNEKMSKRNDPYEEIADGIDKVIADKITKLKLNGIDITKSKKRFYPGDFLAAHSIGFVAYKNDELAGRYGLERYYDNILSRSKDNPYVNFFAEVFSNINKSLFVDTKREGNIVTSIEPRVESILENELEQVKMKYEVDQIGGIIMNPKDGSIYALAVSPTFNLNNFNKIKEVKTFSNPLVENVYEFGSVIKPLVMASAINENVINANTKYNDTGSVIVDNKEIFNFDKKGRGPNTSMQDVLSQSLNTGMVFVSKKLGKDKMRDYIYSYGVKDKTNIDLPNETSGLVSNLNTSRDLEFASASFGQGIALTPIETIRALASLANGGNLITPHLASKIKYDNGNEKILEYKSSKTKISKETSVEITRMLVNVMDNYLKGKNAKLENYSIAGKTGTAQVADRVNGGYYKSRHLHSYFGYFPAADPKFIIFLYALNPKGTEYSTITWSNSFLNITKFLINYYQIPPDR